MPNVLRLPDTVSSGQDLNGLIVDVREYMKWYTHESIKKRSGGSGKQSAPPEISDSAQAVVKDWDDSRDTLDELIHTLEGLHRNAKVITITLAALPSGGVKKTLVGWCRKNLAPDVLVNFSVSQSILGGLVVRVGSHVFDMSFRRQILAEKAKFAEVYERV